MKIPDSSSPSKPLMASVKIVAPCTILDRLRPKNARLILPPSVFPIGTKLNAFVISPVNPAIAKGCSFTKDVVGSGEFNNPPPNKYSIIPDARVDERSRLAGTDGSCCNDDESANAVISNPA